MAYICGKAAGGGATIQDELKPWLPSSCKGWEECIKLVHVCKS